MLKFDNMCVSEVAFHVTLSLTWRRKLGICLAHHHDQGLPLPPLHTKPELAT